MDKLTKFTIAAIPQTLVELLWPKLEQEFMRVVNVAPAELNIVKLKQRLLDGECMAVVVYDRTIVYGVFTLEVKTFETNVRVLTIPILAGYNFTTWMPRAFTVCKGIASDLGCTKIRAIGLRKGWSKLYSNLGWKFVHETAELDLTKEK